MSVDIYKNYSISIVQDKFSNSEGLRVYFLKQGFNVTYSMDAKEALKRAIETEPHIVIINLISEGLNAVLFCEQFYKAKPEARTKIIVTSELKSKQNILNAIEAGASDYVVMPYKQSDMSDRVKYHLRNVQVIKTDKINSSINNERFEILFDVLEFLAEGVGPHETLFKITTLVEKLFPTKRCNIVAGKNLLDFAFVAAASDDESFQKFKLDLARYSEIRQVITTGNLVVIEDIANDPMMKNIKKEFKNIDFNSILVAPVPYKDEIIGVFAVRAEEDSKIFSKEEIKICQLLALSASRPLSSWAFINRGLFAALSQESE